MADRQTFPRGIRRAQARKNKASGHAAPSYKGSFFKTDCVNPACDRKASPTGDPTRDYGTKGGVKPLARCPKCGTAIPKMGYLNRG